MIDEIIFERTRLSLERLVVRDDGTVLFTATSSGEDSAPPMKPMTFSTTAHEAMGIWPDYKEKIVEAMTRLSRISDRLNGSV